VRSYARGLSLLAFAFAAGIGAGAGASALPLARLAPGLKSSELALLEAGESLTRDASQGLSFLPACPEGRSIGAALAAEPSSVRVECAFLIRGKTLAPERKLALYNALTAVRGLSGVKYFSYTRNKETVLLDDVFRTDAPGSMKRLPDQAAASLPGTSSLELHARDANFGSTWYRLSLDSRGPGFALTLVNTEPQGILFLNAFEKERLRLHYAIASADEGIYVYGLCAASPAKGADRLVDIFSAVQKRLDAIREWVAGQLGAL
jgi:hypothetical protein